MDDSSTAILATTQTIPKNSLRQRRGRTTSRKPRCEFRILGKPTSCVCFAARTHGKSRISPNLTNFFRSRTSPSAKDGDYSAARHGRRKLLGCTPLTGRRSERFEKPFAASCCRAGSSFGASCSNNKIAIITWYPSPEGIRRRASR
jgi:hypothetical protein